MAGRKKQITFTVDIELIDKIEKISRTIGMKKSHLVNDILKDSLSAFEYLFQPDKTMTMSGALQYLAEKMKELEDEIKAKNNKQ